MMLEEMVREVNYNMVGVHTTASGSVLSCVLRRVETHHSVIACGVRAVDHTGRPRRQKFPIYAQNERDAVGATQN
jgi:hypothetical protein